MQDEFIIKSLDGLKAISHPLRLDILRQFRQPTTVKSVATALDTVPTKLYYHVNLLEENGIIQVVETNMVSGILEKTYRATARRYRVDEALISSAKEGSEHLDALLNALFHGARREMQSSLDHGLLKLGEKDESISIVARGHYYLTEAEAQNFQQELEALLTKYQTCMTQREETVDKETAVYGLTTLFFPLAPDPEENSSDNP